MTDDRDPHIVKQMIAVSVSFLFILMMLAVAVVGFALVLTVMASVLGGFAFVCLILLVEIADPGAGAAIWDSIGTYGQIWLVVAGAFGFALALMPTAEPY